LQRDLSEASGLLERGAVDQAVALLRRTVQTNPESADAHMLMGSALALLPRRQEALAELGRAVELAPNSAVVHNTLGMALARFAEFGSARGEFEKAITLNPELMDPHMNLALLLAQRDESDAAAEQIARALRLCGMCVKASYLHYLEGKLYDKRGMPHDAVTAFEAAIRMDRNFADAYLELSSARLKLHDEPGAVQALEAAVRLAPSNAEARYRLGVEYLERDNAGGAAAQLREAYRLKPDDRGIVYNFARALRARGNAPEADEVFQKVADLLKQSSQASEQLLQTRDLNDEGVNLEKSGQVAAAIEKYRAALKIDPLLGPVRRNLALALCRQGRWDAGIAELRETLRLYPDDAETTRALYIALDQQAATVRR
jgi:tetratricopeptide (TPR) repeat protein